MSVSLRIWSAAAKPETPEIELSGKRNEDSFTEDL